MRTSSEELPGRERLRPLRVAGDIVTPKALASDGTWCVLVLACGGASGPPLHRHAWEEAFVATQGRLRVRIGDVDHDLGPGEAVTVPPNAPHSYRALVAGTAAVVVLSTVECVALFEAMDGVEDISAVMTIAARHGVVMLGPPLAG